LVLLDESGLFLNPVVRRTWALRGQTPRIGGDGGHRRKVSVIGAVSVSPTVHQLGFRWSTRVNGYWDTAGVVEFVRCLLGWYSGNVLVVWDGGPNHQGPVLRQFLSRNRRIRLERLPAYAPELNPVEYVWSWLKYGEMANFVPSDLIHLNHTIGEHLRHLEQDQELLRALWNGSDLPFPANLNG
jgi:hypothetical protein